MNSPTTIVSRLCGAAALVLVALAASAIPELFTLDSRALGAGQVWRLWTGHLVHGSSGHFLFDVGVALLLIPALRSRWTLVWMPPVVSLGLFACYPQLESYYGLSALLHGLVIMIAGRLVLRGRGLEALIGWVVILMTLTKALMETLSNAPLFTAGIDMGGPVFYGSHLVGSIVGLLTWGAQAVMGRENATPGPAAETTGPGALEGTRVG